MTRVREGGRRPYAVLRTGICFRLAACLTGIGLAAPVGASAANIEFTVVNPDGVEQASTSIKGAPDATVGFGQTDAYGRYTLTGALPGDDYYFTRDYSSPSCGVTPEGTTGVRFDVPSPAPATATIVLPSANGPAASPGLSNSERGLVGLINQERAAAGAQPVRISTVLSESADRYANHLLSTNQFGHCLFGGGRAGLIDLGFPVNSGAIYENLHKSSGGSWGAFNGWSNSAGHRQNMLRSTSAVIGVGNVGGVWVARFAQACIQPVGCERGGFTGDIGDASLADGAPSAGKGKRACAKKRGLAAKRCKARARCKRLTGKKRARCRKQAKRIGSRQK